MTNYVLERTDKQGKKTYRNNSDFDVNPFSELDENTYLADKKEMNDRMKSWKKSKPDYKYKLVPAAKITFVWGPTLFKNTKAAEKWIKIITSQVTNLK